MNEHFLSEKFENKIIQDDSTMTFWKGLVLYLEIFRRKFWEF